MTSDLTFITNEPGRNLLERFQVLVKDTRFFDVLVGYFYTSGFYKLHRALEKTEKIRILIGISTNRQTFDLLQTGRQMELQFSHAEVKTRFADRVAGELETSEDQEEIHHGVQRFVEWVRSGKLQIKAYPSENLHAKLYIMTFAEGDRDAGRVITGSSNFTAAGLVDNLELNVELKNRSDYEFALGKFNELWADAVEVSQKYLETIQTRTWLNDTITPYELYLKFLYEYFKEKINLDAIAIESPDLPERFKELEYQAEAVRDAKSKLEEYGGVFISDVVGLGKTYITALLAKQLEGRCLVLASPILLSKDNPGSWVNVLSDFRVHYDAESIGQLDNVIRRGADKYQNIIIDEAHRFRSETTSSYEQLAEICRGKRVILVSATPYNNRPADILAQLKLFQKSRKSTIPNLPDLDRFFARLEKRLRGLDRQKNHDEYLAAVCANARDIREKVLKYLMIRRTRHEVATWFGADLAKQGLKFPTVADPQALYYQLNEKEDAVFTRTVELLARRLTFARYTPLQYYTGPASQPEKQAQRNLGKLMKILLIKRLESSFFAFRNSLKRFIASYELFIAEFDRGKVYVSKKHSQKIFDYLEDGDEEGIQKLLDEDKAEQFAAKDFDRKFRADLEHDLTLLREIAGLWAGVKRDPKLLAFARALQEQPILARNKLIVFTESKETADYLSRQLADRIRGGIITFAGGAGAPRREQVIANFDANARHPKDDYRVLITTEVLAEGVNLHRSNVVINYDLPWNPTRMMQRVGRVNRVDTPFDTIHTFNFFPTKQANDQLKLKEAAEMKINAFITMLGNDARLLTDDEDVVSFSLFARLTSKRTITGEDETDETEFKYLAVIRELRDREPELFGRIKRLPKKARTARAATGAAGGLLTYFRKGKIQKFFLTDPTGTTEADFFTAARMLEALAATPRLKVGPDYFDLLAQNKRAFDQAVAIEEPESARGGRDSATQILHILKTADLQHCPSFTDEDELYLERVATALGEGALPRKTTKKLLSLIARELKKEINPLKILAILRANIPAAFFNATLAENAAAQSGPREVVLSEYLLGA